MSTKGNLNAVFVSGNTGEGFVESIIQQTDLPYYHDIYLKGLDGKITQIDFLVVTDRSLVCVEVKNYSKCVIKGDDDVTCWTACYRSGTKNFLNPIKQNKIHTELCKDLFGKDLTVYSVIVFSNNCGIRTVPTEQEYTSVINMTDLWYELIDIKNDTGVKRFKKEYKAEVIDKLDKFYLDSDKLFNEHQSQLKNKRK